MPPSRIVEALDEVEDPDPRLALGAEADAIEQLALERGEEALTHCIVVAVAHRSHRRLDAGLATPQPERDRRVLAALVRVVDHTGRPPLSQRHVERVQHELGAQVVRHRPADDPSAPRIDHHRQIQEPRPRRHVRDVRHPELVGTRCSEVALNEVRGRTRVAIPSRRPRSPSTRDPLDPGSAHESRDPLAIDRYAVGGELGVDPRNPVGPSREGKPPGPQTVILKFDSVEKVKEWYNSPDYQKVVGKRLAATEGFAVISQEMNMG